MTAPPALPTGSTHPSPARAPRSRLKTTMLAAALAAFAAPAAAAPDLLQSRRVDTLASHCCWDNWLNIQTASGSENFYQVNSWGQAWATVQAQTAQFGAVGGHVSAGSVNGGGYTASGGGATLRDGWVDQFTITSGSLPAGTPVQLKLTLVLDLALSAPDPDGSGSNAHTSARGAAAFHYGGWDAPWITGLDFRAGSDHAQQQLGGVFTTSAVIGAAVGQVVGLAGDMGLEYGQRIQNQPQPWFAGFADGAARFHVDLLTPGASYTTASGFSYATPVPEPATWALMAGGLLAVGRLARRRGTTASH